MDEARDKAMSNLSDLYGILRGDVRKLSQWVMETLTADGINAIVLNDNREIAYYIRDGFDDDFVIPTIYIVLEGGRIVEVKPNREIADTRPTLASIAEDVVAPLIDHIVTFGSHTDIKEESRFTVFYGDGQGAVKRCTYTISYQSDVFSVSREDGAFEKVGED